jgi:hypothetical protein
MATSMNRRDFLCLKTTPQGRTLELSCRHLYMRYLDAQVARGDDGRAAVEQYDVWMGEPAAAFTRRTPDALVQSLADELRNVEVLRINDIEWLAATDLRTELEPLLATFRARGGVLEYGAPHDPEA